MATYTYGDLYVWRLICMATYMYGELYVWRLICMATYMYGDLYVWRLIRMATYHTARNMDGFKYHPSFSRNKKMLLHERCRFRSL